MTNSPKCKVSFCVRFYKICQFFYELVLIFLILSWLFMVVTVGTLYKEAVEICLLQYSLRWHTAFILTL